MADTLRLEIVTPEKIVVSEAVQSVMAPGSEGSFGVLPGHTTFLSTLSAGPVQFRNADGEEHFAFVSSGFAEVLPSQVTVLVESTERRKDIDAGRAKSALERAERRLSEKGAKIDQARAEAAMARALARLQLADARG